MRVLLKHETPLGSVHIARAPDGRYHVLWGDDSLGSADSLPGALVRASAGPLKKARDGTDVVSMGLSRDAARWAPGDALATGPRRAEDAEAASRAPDAPSALRSMPSGRRERR